MLGKRHPLADFLLRFNRERKKVSIKHVTELAKSKWFAFTGYKPKEDK